MQMQTYGPKALTIETTSGLFGWRLGMVVMMMMCHTVRSDQSQDAVQEQVKAGTLNKLVERLTSAKSHDYMYVKTFLLTYQSFSTPSRFFQKLEERYDMYMTSPSRQISCT